MKYNVSEIIDFEIISIFQKFSLITFILTVILELFYGIIVYLTTTKTMQFFRILTFIYIFECILTEFFMFCWKPFRLFPYTIFYPTGILAPMSSTWSALMATFYPFGHACFVETLTITVVERHFRIVGNVTKTKKISIYFLFVVTFFCMAIPAFIFFLQNINDTKVTTLLNSEVENVEQILDLQPSLYSIDYTYSTTLWMLVFTCLIYVTIRFVAFFLVLKENLKFVKKKNISEKTRKQFTLMFHSTMIQLCTTLFFASFAAIWVITFLFWKNNAGIKATFYISISIAMCYPIADVIIVIAVVKGYRNTLKKIFVAITGKQKRKISGFGFQNISINGVSKFTAAAKRKMSVF